MADYIIINGELYHHGVKGQKWGVRRYQNPDGSLTAKGKKRQARQYTKELNKLDRKQSEALSDSIRSDGVYQRRRAAVEKYSKKYENDPSQRNEERLRKSKEKMEAAKKVRDEDANRYKQIDSESWNKILKAADSGYTVNSKEVIRNTKVGEQIATQALGGIIGTIAVSSIVLKSSGDRYKTTLKDGRTFDQNPWMVKGFKYKVT